MELAKPEDIASTKSYTLEEFRKLGIPFEKVVWPMTFLDISDFIYMIFKCKSDCKTIFTYDNIVQM